jgi:hypothetical protein
MLAVVIELHVAPTIWNTAPPLSANANTTIPSAPCQRCHCSMSVYRQPWEVWCWPCQSAEPGVMPTPAARERGSASTVILGQLLAGAATAREIREATGIPAPTIKEALHRLVGAGSVAKTANGRAPRYHLTTSD